ncbi:probable LRR receptor-like serine threonine-kinase At1g12460 [Olea europaea subsp. europaea]|uniref:Probable LRR receptor-like serine threonine-kinase At1g12460 n=1 Tax=Olea europaea subsp. europaea TaxID=158383 RepID=A0A8S0PGG4_OLEEU|nr:probable LRR receptor-like serine threonine-kinase At1g12460 [Olea europaea subsp. europaea]
MTANPLFFNLHLNVKSTNILLDENYIAKLSDYGLGKLLPLLDNYGLTKIHNAVGYIAPELAQSSQLSEKCDIYSFGGDSTGVSYREEAGGKSLNK